MSFDFDLFVIGAGSGGVRAARFAAGYGARIAIAESRYLGGTCVNVGCIPKKLLSYSAHFRDDFKNAVGYGWDCGEPKFDWATLVANKKVEIRRLNSVYRNLLVNSNVLLLEGHASIVDPHRVEVDGRQFTAQHILIATGGWPVVPDIPGKELAITSNEVFSLETLPERIVIVGGGYIAIEFASIFHGLGSQTSLLYRRDLFLRGFDQSIREHLRDEMLRKGLDLQFNADIQRIDKLPDGRLQATLNSGETLEADVIFYGTGRRPMLDNLGLEHTRVSLDERGFVKVNDLYETDEPSILAIGDIIGRVQLTPVALEEGMAIAKRLFKPELYRPVDYDLIATGVFSLPNIASVGLSEEQAKEKGYRIRVYEEYFRLLRFTITDNQEKSLMKIIVDDETDRVLGCHMIGPEAAEILQGVAVAIKAGATKQVFDETMAIHPTAAEEFVTMREITRVV